MKAADMALVAIPFMPGFSTNLALQILDRFIISVRTFLGISAGKSKNIWQAGTEWICRFEQLIFPVSYTITII
jgi:hypothetical protein